MTVAVALPFALSILLALAAGPLARRLTPATGARGLAVTAAVVALSTLLSLSLLVIGLVVDLPARLSVLGGIALAWSAGRIGGALWRRRALRQGLAPLVAGSQGELVVVRDLPPHAFAVAGNPGRIVVSAAMLRALTAPQRRAMLAHERAHLDQRHSVLLTLAQFAAAANPLLGRIRTAVGYLCERHADEQAAAVVGDRFLVAEALAAAALAASGSRSEPAPAFHKVGVVARVAALVDPPRQYRSAGLVSATAVALVALTSACDATDQFYELIRHALAL